MRICLTLGDERDKKPIKPILSSYLKSLRETILDI